MADRYKNKKVKINERGKQYYKSLISTNIPVQNSDLRIVARAGDRLDILANKYYKNPSYWWIIAEANKLRDGGFALDPSVEIRVPGNIQPILQEFRRINEEFLDR